MELNMISMPMLGSQAPRFCCASTQGFLKLTDYIGKWLVLFSTPSAFMPTCTTEIMSFSKLNNEFSKRDCCILGLTSDNAPSQIAWVKDIEKNTGINVPFPIISDCNGEVSNMYGMKSSCLDENTTQRNVYIIDPKQKIRFVCVYPSQNGRNITEILRMLDAIKKSDEEGVCTPADWIPSKDTLTCSSDGYIDFMEKIKVKNNASGYNMDWYACFNNDSNNLRSW